MISRNEGSTTFSLSAVQALQAWADSNLISGEVYLHMQEGSTKSDVDRNNWDIVDGSIIRVVRKEISTPNSSHSYGIIVGRTVASGSDGRWDIYQKSETEVAYYDIIADSEIVFTPTNQLDFKLEKVAGNLILDDTTDLGPIVDSINGTSDSSYCGFGAFYNSDGSIYGATADIKLELVQVNTDTYDFTQGVIGEYTLTSSDGNVATLEVNAEFSDGTIAPPSTRPVSEYTKEVNLPTYTGAAHQKVISSDADWSSINDPAITEFFVEPGDYTALDRIEITASGSDGSPRWIVLHNGNDTHPGQLDLSEKAHYWLNLSGDWWVIDRWYSDMNFAYWDGNQVDSSNTIVNRPEMTNNQILMYSHSSNNVTVQNGWFYDNAFVNDSDDCPAVITGGHAYNFYMLNCDVRNCGDGFNATGTDTVDYDQRGHRIDNNQMWCTDATYTDGEGNYDPNGLYSTCENAIGYKNGSLEPTDPWIVSNNRLWGWRYSDITTGSSAATLIGTMVGTANGIIRDNLMFDSHNAINAGGHQSMPYSRLNVDIIGNTFIRIGKPVDPMPVTGTNWNSGNIRVASDSLADGDYVANNDFIDTVDIGTNANSSGVFMYQDADSVDITIENNNIIDSSTKSSYFQEGIVSADRHFTDNHFTNQGTLDLHTGYEFTNSDLVTVDMVEVTFDYEIYTNDPKTKTVQVVRDSPVYLYLTGQAKKEK